MPETKDNMVVKKRPSLWHNRDFLFLSSGQAVSTLGTQISNLAMPLLVLALTGLPTQAGIVAALQTFPFLLLSLPAGALIDRWDRKKVMIICDLVRVLTFGSIPLAYLLGFLTMPLLYVLALISGTGFVFFGIAAVSSLPCVVSPQQLPQASGITSAIESAAQFVGPGVGGFLISLARTTIVGTVITYFIDSVSYAISAFSLLWIRIPFQGERTARAKRTLHREILEGLRFLWNHRILRIIGLLNFCMNFLVGPSYLAVIVLARGPLHADTRTLGIIFSIGSIGGILGSSIAPWIIARLSYIRVIIFTVIGTTLALLLLSLASSPLFLILGLALLSLSIPIQTVTLISYRLSVTAEAMQGRVNSIVRLLVFGGMSIGQAAGGLLLGIVDPRRELWLLTIGSCLCAIGFGLSLTLLSKRQTG